VSNSVWPHRRQPTRLPRPWDSPGKNTGVGCHFLLQCMKVKRESEVAQLCPTLLYHKSAQSFTYSFSLPFCQTPDNHWFLFYFILSHLIFNIILVFTLLEHFRFPAKLRGSYRDFSQAHYPSTCIASCIINIPTRVIHLLQLTNLRWHNITVSP